MEVLKRVTKKVSIFSIVGWIGIIALAIIKGFVPALSFLTTGFWGLILMIAFLLLIAQPFLKKEKK